MCNHLSLSVVCYTASLLEDSGASAWTHSTQQHCLHIAVHFLKKVKNTAMNGSKLFVSKWTASAKPGWALGAVFGFLVLIISPVLAAGILGLRLHRHVNDQKCLVSLSFPSYGPLVPASSPVQALMFTQLRREQGRARGWAMALGRGAVCSQVLLQQFLALAHFSRWGFWYKGGSSGLWQGSRAMDSLRIYF